MNEKHQVIQTCTADCAEWGESSLPNPACPLEAGCALVFISRGKFRSRVWIFCTTVVQTIDEYQMQDNALNKRWLEERAGAPGGMVDDLLLACLDTLLWAICLISWELVFYFTGGKRRMDTSQNSNEQRLHLCEKLALVSAAAWGWAS